MLAGGADYAQSHAARADDPKYHKGTWMKANPSLAAMPDLESPRSSSRGGQHARRDPSLLASFEALRLNLGTSDVLKCLPSWLRPRGMGIEGEAGAGRGVHVGGSTLARMQRHSRLSLHSGRKLAGWKSWRRSRPNPPSPSVVYATAWRNLYDRVRATWRADRVPAGQAVNVCPTLLGEALQRFGRPAALSSDRWRAAELM